jgi:hypothetical protein
MGTFSSLRRTCLDELRVEPLGPRVLGQRSLLAAAVAEQRPLELVEVDLA